MHQIGVTVFEDTLTLPRALPPLKSEEVDALKDILGWSQFFPCFLKVDNINHKPLPGTRSFHVQFLFDPVVGGTDFEARATDGGLGSMVMRSVSMCDKVMSLHVSDVLLVGIK